MPALSQPQILFRTSHIFSLLSSHLPPVFAFLPFYHGGPGPPQFVAYLHLWCVKFLKREVVLKNPTFSRFICYNSVFSSVLNNFIFAFFACIFFIYTRLRKGAKSFSPCALSTPSLIAMKRTPFCGKIISLIWTRPQIKPRNGLLTIPAL